MIAVLWRAVSLKSFDHRVSMFGQIRQSQKLKSETKNAKFFMEGIFLRKCKFAKSLLVQAIGGQGWIEMRYRTGYCRLCWILSEVQQPTSLRIHKSDLILGRYPPAILNVTRITAIPRLILIDPLSLTMPCLQVKDIIILLRVSAEQ